MDVLCVTVVGTENFKLAEDIFAALGLSDLGEYDKGAIGNMKTRAYRFQLEDDSVISKRKELMERLMAGDRFTAMYVHGDWMRVYVFKKI